MNEHSLWLRDCRYVIAWNHEVPAAWWRWKTGDCVRCGCHGLKFGAQGDCIEGPGLSSVPPKALVKTTSRGAGRG